jgi:hypothetical protein
VFHLIFGFIVWKEFGIQLGCFRRHFSAVFKPQFAASRRKPSIANPQEFLPLVKVAFDAETLGDSIVTSSRSGSQPF